MGVEGCSPLQLTVIYDVVLYCGTVFIWLWSHLSTILLMINTHIAQQPAFLLASLSVTVSRSHFIVFISTNFYFGFILTGDDDVMVWAWTLFLPQLAAEYSRQAFKVFFSPPEGCSMRVKKFCKRLIFLHLATQIIGQSSHSETQMKNCTMRSFQKNKTNGIFH